MLFYSTYGATTFHAYVETLNYIVFYYYYYITFESTNYNYVGAISKTFFKELMVQLNISTSFNFLLLL
jgi:hypothetical protein